MAFICGTSHKDIVFKAKYNSMVVESCQHVRQLNIVDSDSICMQVIQANLIFD